MDDAVKQREALSATIAELEGKLAEEQTKVVEVQQQILEKTADAKTEAQGQQAVENAQQAEKATKEGAATADRHVAAPQSLVATSGSLSLTTATGRVKLKRKRSCRSRPSGVSEKDANTYYGWWMRMKISNEGAMNWPMDLREQVFAARKKPYEGNRVARRRLDELLAASGA